MKEISGWENFGDYLLELEKSQGEKPFDCSNLIVLPEDVLYKQKLEDVEYKAKYLNDPELFRKGSLLCHPRAFSSGGHLPRCAIKSEIELNEAGELEVLCDGRYNIGHLSIKIKSFKKFNQE